MWLLRNSLTLIFMLSLVFLAACDGTKTTPGTDALTDGIAADDDLITDDLIPDEEEPDEADIDTKPDPDKVEADTVDGDIADVEPDDDIVTGPCSPNPCEEMAGSTGECTVDEDAFICGCEENYTWDAEEKECVANMRRTNCANIPQNAHGTGDNADGKYEQTWDGEAWLPASVVCTWECDNNYSLNEEETGCLADTQRVDCTNIPPNAHGVLNNADGKFQQVWNGESESWEPSSFTCAWACDDNYTKNGEVCDANTRRVACVNSLPDDAHWADPNADGKFLQTWNGSTDEWEPLTSVCAWVCDENFSLNDEEDGCVANTRRTDCVSAKPDHSHYSGENDDDKFEQTWDAGSNDWTPAFFTCKWDCDDNYTFDSMGPTCVPDTRPEECTNTLPDNAYWIDPNADGTFEQTWDGDSWEPATFSDCAWECDEHYTQNGLVCDPKTQRADCVNQIPDHAFYSGANDDGKFEQTWDGGIEDWTPAPETVTCEWECDKGYPINEAEDDCVFQPIVYVNHAATDGENTGYSWADAFTDLQDALKQVIAGQEIWVATGTYKPSRCPYFDGCDDKEKTFMMFRDTGVDFVLYGGFDGTETTRDQRDWETNETILSGDITGDDAWDDVNGGWLNRTDNVYRVLVFDPAMPSNTLLLDGFTVSGGHSEGMDNRGGAVSSTNHAVEVRNCVFRGNVASGGGAIFVMDGQLTVDNSFFYRNAADPSSSGSGGAIATLNAPLSLTDSVFDENFAGDNAGAVNCNGNVTISGSSFLNNHAAGNAAALSIGNATLATITDTDFVGNTSGFGGAIGINTTTSVVVASCYFEANEATDENGSGGAISVNADSFSLSNSQFVDNSASMGSAVKLWTVADATVTSVTFTGNTGSAISADGGALVITNSTFTDNTAAVNRVSAIEMQDASSLSISSSSFLSNEADRSTINVRDTLLFSVNDCSFQNNNGSAINMEGTPLQMTDCDFIGNHAASGAAVNPGDGDHTITNCRFKNNAADLPGEPDDIFAGWGGVMAMMGANMTVINSVFEGNTAAESGGAVAAIWSTLSFVNCTFTGNTDLNGDGIVYIGTNGPVNNTVLWDTVKEVTSITVGSDVYDMGPSNPTFSYSDVKGSGGSAMTCGIGGDESCWVLPFGTDGGNNIDADPLFVASGDNPLDLQGGSPCVDAGSNALVPEGLLYDILGDARIQNTTVDMGAYEQ